MTVRITERSSQLEGQPGLYCVLVSPTVPSDAWKHAFHEAAKTSEEGRSLALKVSGSRITYRLLDGRSPVECEGIIQAFMDQAGPA
jgi:hypothetical protein